MTPEQPEPQSEEPLPEEPEASSEDEDAEDIEPDDGDFVSDAEYRERFAEECSGGDEYLKELILAAYEDFEQEQAEWRASGQAAKDGCDGPDDPA